MSYESLGEFLNECQFNGNLKPNSIPLLKQLNQLNLHFITVRNKKKKALSTFYLLVINYNPSDAEVIARSCKLFLIE